jgi:hypothetical protein
MRARRDCGSSCRPVARTPVARGVHGGAGSRPGNLGPRRRFQRRPCRVVVRRRARAAETPPQAAAPSPPSPGAIPIAPRPAKRLRSTPRRTGRGPQPLYHALRRRLRTFFYALQTNRLKRRPSFQTSFVTIKVTLLRYRRTGGIVKTTQMKESVRRSRSAIRQRRGCSLASSQDPSLILPTRLIITSMK